MSGDKSLECIIYDVKIRLIYLIQVSVMIFTIETYFLIYLNLISFLNTKKKLYICLLILSVICPGVILIAILTFSQKIPLDNEFI